MRTNVAVSLAFLASMVAACSPDPDSVNAEKVGRPDYAASNLVRVRPGYQIRIVGDDGDDLGAVNAYYVNERGQIVWAAPADRTLEPADASTTGSDAIS